MLTHIVGRALNRGTTCRNGHVWTDRARPVACSQCGRTRPAQPVR